MSNITLVTESPFQEKFLSTSPEQALGEIILF